MKRDFDFRARWGWLVCLTLCAAAPELASQPRPAATQSVSAASEHFAAGSRAFEQQDYLHALAEFQAAIAAGSDGPAVHYNVAVCHYRLGEYARAEAAFRALGQRFPAMRNLADYNLGLVLTRLDRATEARTAFERARLGGDERIAALSGAMLARLPAGAPVSPAPAWIRLLDLRFGHDDNVALIDAASLPAGRSTDSPFGEIFAYASGPTAGRWRLDASAYLIGYPDAGEFDQRGLYLAGLYRWSAGAWRVAAGPHYSYAILDGEGFERRLGASVDASRAFSPRLTFGVNLAHDDIDDLEPQFAYLEGEREQLRLVLDAAVQSGRLLADYQVERNNRAGPSISADRDRYSIRYRRFLRGAWTGELMYEHRVSDYSRLAQPREEKRRQVGFQALRDIARDWQFSAQYRYADNDSDDSVYVYERHRFAAGLSKLF